MSSSPRTKKTRPGGYPSPLIIPPLSPTQHTHTLILLHGRGSNATRFGPELLHSSSLPARLPTVRFVFPTASKRRCTARRRIPINQWFDNASLEQLDLRPDLQIEGLCETARMLRELVEQEVEVLGLPGQKGYRRIVLGGLSQGCAAGVFAMLGGAFGEDEGEVLGGFVGMSGRLPFERQLRDIGRSFDEVGVGCAEGDTIENGDMLLSVDANLGSLNLDEHGFSEEEETGHSGDVSEDSDDDSRSEDAVDANTEQHALEVDYLDPFEEAYDGEHDTPETQMLNYIRDVLDLPFLSLQTTDNGRSKTQEVPAAHLRIPVFLGHGTADPKVPCYYGEGMADFLKNTFHMDVKWKAYEDFGHWYKIPDEIDDIVCFLRAEVGIPVCELKSSAADEPGVI